MQNLLNNHPEICGGPEFDRVPDIVKLRDQLQASVASGRIGEYCTTEKIDEAIGCFIEDLLLPYASKHNARMVSEKTPWNVLYFSQLIQVFPSAKLVFCVRDPRAVVSSMLQVGGRFKERGQMGPAFTRSINSAIQLIKKCNATGLDAYKKNKDQVLLVKYENLVNTPEETGKKICNFLNVEFFDQMLALDKGKDNVVKHADGLWNKKEALMQKPDKRRLNAWQDKLTIYQQVYITNEFKNDQNLNELGYELADTNIPCIPKRFYLFISIHLHNKTYNLLRMLLSILKANRFSKRLYRFVRSVN